MAIRNNCILYTAMVHRFTIAYCMQQWLRQLHTVCINGQHKGAYYMQQNGHDTIAYCMQQWSRHNCILYAAMVDNCILYAAMAKIQLHTVCSHGTSIHYCIWYAALVKTYLHTECSNVQDNCIQQVGMVKTTAYCMQQWPRNNAYYMQQQIYTAFLTFSYILTWLRLPMLGGICQKLYAT